MTRMALCLALCCISANLFFPLPATPGNVTAITIFLSVSAYVLSPRQTFMVVAAYLLLGIAGLPIFAGNAGIGKLLSPVGGFYLAWLIAYPVLSRFNRQVSFRRYVLTNLLVAMPITYAGGISSTMLFMHVDATTAATLAVVPFLIGDSIKACIAATISVKINS